MKHYRKLLSLLLIICISMTMLTGYIPVNAVTPATETPSENITPFELPDIVDTAEAEEKDYIGRVKTEEKDLHTFVFANGDGTNTMRVYGHPVKYIAKDGTIRDISLDVKAKADGGFVTADHEIITTFEKTLTDGISLAYDDVEVTLIPKLGLGKVPAATLDSNNKVVTYKMNDVTSFVYELTYAGFKEDIVVKEYTGQTEYEFTLFTNGLTLCEKYGSYYLADAEGNVEATIGDIIVFTADERNNTMGSMTYETVRANQEYVLTIHLDAEYLADEKTAYPIRIDPTIEINYDSNGAGAIEDITINSLQGSDGSSRSLFVGRRDEYGLSRVLMRFPTLNLAILSSGFYIDSASVEIRDLMCQGDEDITVECRIYNNNAPTWEEDETTSWQSVGSSYVGDLLDSHVISYGEGNVASDQHRYSFNILNAVKAWANGTEDPNKGLVFKASDSFENQTGDAIKTWYKTFASYNRSDYRPSLTITYRHGISLNYLSLEMNIGEIKQLSTSAILGYTPTNYSLRWQSTNSRIATVNSTTGQLQAKAPGKVTIKVYFYQDPTIYQNITLTVNNATSATSNITSDCVYMIRNISTGKYLSATSSTQVSVATRNAYDGRQLWYVQWTGSGYRLYSLGIKDTASNGQKETMLRGYNANSSPRVQANYATFNKWNISYNNSNGYYYFTNTHNNNTSLSVNASDNSVKHISLASENEYARWTFEKIDTATFNNYWKGDFSGQGDTIHVKINIDSSGSDSVYSNSIITSDDFDVVNQWKNKSSRVVIYGPNDTVPSNISAFEVTFKGYVPSGNIVIDGNTYPAKSVVCGETNGYKKVLLLDTKTTPDNDWSSVIISLNTSSSGPLAMDDDLIRKTIIHELGHALKLAHPKHADYTQDVTNGRGKYADDNSVCALMNQGTPNSTLNLTCATPKWHDIINLKNKWEE